MDKKPITPEGHKRLKDELDYIKNIKRQDIIDAISEARAHGDLKENAEYHAAKEQQAQLESKVIEINDTIARANVIDVTKFENDGKIIFGSTLTVKDLDNEKEIKYKIVGKDEANVAKNLIYYKSPIAKSLIGKMVGDLISVSTPSGERSFEILKVDYL